MGAKMPGCRYIWDFGVQICLGAKMPGCPCVGAISMESKIEFYSDDFKKNILNLIIFK